MNIPDASEFVMNHVRRAHEQGIAIRTREMGVSESAKLQMAWELNTYDPCGTVGVCGLGAVALGRKILGREYCGETISRVMAVSCVWRCGFTDHFDNPDLDLDYSHLDPSNLTERQFGTAAALAVRQMCALEGIEVHE